MARYKIYYSAYSSESATEYSRFRSTATFYLATPVFFAILGAVIWYCYSIYYLFTDQNYLNFLYALLAMIASAWLCAYFVVIREPATDKSCKEIVLKEKKRAKEISETDAEHIASEINNIYKDIVREGLRSYWRYFCPCFVGATGLIGFVISIYLLYLNKGGFSGLIISLFIIAIGTTWFILAKSKAPTRVKNNTHRQPDTSVPTKKTAPTKKISYNDPVVESPVPVERKLSDPTKCFCVKCGSEVSRDYDYCDVCGAKIVKRSEG